MGSTEGTRWGVGRSTLLLDFKDWVIHWGWGRGAGCCTPTSWDGRGLQLRSASGVGREASGEAGCAATTAALITFSPDLISHQGLCNFFQFST